MKKLMLFAIVSVMMIGCAKDEAPEPKAPQTTNEEILTKANPDGRILNDYGDGMGPANPVYYLNLQHGFQLVDFRSNIMGNIVWRLYDSRGVLMDSKCITPRSLFNFYNSRVFIKFPKADTFSITATYSIPAGGGLAQSLMVQKDVWVSGAITHPRDPFDPGMEITW